jgi:hypothetical protein
MPISFLYLALDGPINWIEGLTLLFSSILVFPALTSYLSLNFTGSSTFTSRTGVRKEIFTYIPVMAVMGGVGIILFITWRVLTLTGVW